MKTQYIGQLATIAARTYLGGQSADPRRIAQHLAAPWAIPSVEKAMVEANEAALAVDSATGAQLTASIEQMTSRSLLLMCQQRGAVDYDLLRAGLLQLDEISPTAAVVDENAPAAIAAKVPYGVVLLTPNRIQFLTPVTLELMRSQFAAQALEARAQDAVSRGLDAALLTLIGNVNSGGGISATTDANSDVAELISLISVTGAQPLIFGMAPDVAARASVLRQGGCLCFPGAVAVGQSEIGGLPALATDRVAAGSMWCIDPSGLAVHIEAISVSASQAGAIQMSDSPSGAAALVSAFQAGMIVVSVSVRFGLAVIRQADVAAELASIEWASA